MIGFFKSSKANKGYELSICIHIDKRGVGNYIERERQMNENVDKIFRQQKDGKIDQSGTSASNFFSDSSFNSSSGDSGVHDEDLDNEDSLALTGEISCKLN